MPATYYHNDWVKKFGPDVIDAVKARLLTTTERTINEVKREKLVEIFDSIDLICNRIMEKAEAANLLKTIKLRFCEHLRLMG